MLNESPLSPICSQALLEPLRKYRFFYDEIKDKNVEETRKLLIDLAKAAIELDHEITKDIHDVLIDLQLAYCENESPSCLVSLEDLTEENKTEFTILVEDNAIIIYTINSLQSTFNARLEWPHNRRTPTAGELAYLDKKFNIVPIVADPDIYYFNFERETNRGMRFRYDFLRLSLGTFAALHLGWLFLYIPLLALNGIVNERNPTRDPLRATYLAAFASIFCLLLGTGVTRRWAEDYNHYFMIPNPGLNALGLASSVAVLSAIVLIILVQILLKIASNIQHSLAASSHPTATEAMHLIQGQNDNNYRPYSSINHGVR